MEKETEICRIYTAKGNLAKNWFVYYYVKVGKINKRIRVYDNINSFDTAELRIMRAKELCSLINFKQKGNEVVILSSNTLISALKTLVDNKKALRKKTYHSYKNHVETLITWLKENKRFSIKPYEFTKPLCFQYMDYRLSTGITTRTYNNVRNFLKTLFDELILRDECLINPFRFVRCLPETPKTHVAFNQIEQAKIKRHCKENNLSGLLLYIQFIYYCYIRPGELRQLQVKHINWDDKTICIPANISKNKKTMWVVIPDVFFVELLSSNLYDNPESFYIFGKNLLPSENPIIADKVAREHRSVLNQLNITKEHTLYSWKHTGVISALNNGINLKDIQLQLRHHSLDEVNTYLRSLGMLASTEVRNNFPEF